MYKIILSTLLLLASVTLTARTFNVGLRTGVIMSENELDPGIINGLTVGYYLTPSWEVQLSLDYHNQSLTATRKIIQSTTPYEQRDELSEVETTFIPLTLNLQYNIPMIQKITAIVGSGFGLGFLNEKVTPINPDYSHGYDTFDSYAGLSTVAWTGFKYNLSSKFHFLSKLMYHYSNMKSEINLLPHGFIDSIREINGFFINAGIEYNF